MHQPNGLLSERHDQVQQGYTCLCNFWRFLYWNKKVMQRSRRLKQDLSLKMPRQDTSMEIILCSEINFSATIWSISSLFLSQWITWFGEEKHCQDSCHETGKALLKYLSESLSKHMDKTCKLQRGNNCLFFMSCISLKVLWSLSHWVLQTTEKNSLSLPSGSYRTSVDGRSLK